MIANVMNISKGEVKSEAGNGHMEPCPGLGFQGRPQ
jgi:hypothetical protein